MHTPTKETLFILVYGMEAFIPIEVIMRRTWTWNPQESMNITNLQANLNILEERRNNVAIRQASYKAMVEMYYNAMVKGSSCKVGDLVLWKNEISQKEHIGKLSLNSEGPYQVVEVRQNVSYA